MRRQDRWIDLADRLELERSTVVAVCAFLNMKRTPRWISETLGVPSQIVGIIAAGAKPLLRQPRTKKPPKVCAYCGTETGPFQRDHVIPKSRGGSDEPSNLVLACKGCNSAKGARTPAEWLQ